MTEYEEQEVVPQGYIIVAVAFADGSSSSFRIDSGNTDGHVPTYDEMRDEVTAVTDGYAETLLFLGEMQDPKATDRGGWSEECWVQIPRSAYHMVSWQYYTMREINERAKAGRKKASAAQPPPVSSFFGGRIVREGDQ